MTAALDTVRGRQDVAVSEQQQRRQEVVGMQAQFAMVLGDPKMAERFVRVALTAMSKPLAYPGAPTLATCTRESLLGGLITCAQLRLEPNDPRGLAYLIPFRNNKAGTVEAQLILGYRGLADLAYRTGQIKSLAVESVHENDTFTVRRWPRQLQHEETGGPRGDVVSYYAAVEYVSGGIDFVSMSRLEVEDWRDQYSKSAEKKDSPWKTAFDEMAKKTCLRRLAKNMPLSVEDMRPLAAGIGVDGSVQRSIEAPSLEQMISTPALDAPDDEPDEPAVDTETGELADTSWPEKAQAPA